LISIQNLYNYTILVPDSFTFRALNAFVKKIILLTTVFLLPLLTWSQVERPHNYPYIDGKALHFGFSLGLNTMDFSMKRTLKHDPISNDTLIPDVSSIIPPGFQVQIVSDVRLGENFNLRFLPGISFGQRNLSFYYLSNGSKDISMDIGSAFLDFPLSLKYSSNRLNNYRPYIIGGLNYRYDMASRNDEKVFVHIKPGDIYLEIGVGIDWYLPYFKLGTEIKMGLGLRNLMIYDSTMHPQYMNSLGGLKSYIVALSFHFE
jgi:hypothetical protein